MEFQDLGPQEVRALSAGWRVFAETVPPTEPAELRDLAGQRLVRGFTETECRVYFPDADCPSLDDVLAP